MTTTDDDHHRARRLAHDVGIRIRERIDVRDMERVAVAELGAAFGVDRVLLRRYQDQEAVLGPVVAEWHEVDLEPLADTDLHSIARIDETLADPKLYATDPGKAQALTLERGQMARTLATVEENWLAASETHEAAAATMGG